MKYLRLFGYAAQTTELLPLPSACLTTTVIRNSPSTSINNATLTYRGPLTNSFLSPFALTTTTYTTILTTRGADGTTETQTYTVFGAPVELDRSTSLSSLSPTPTGVISPGQIEVSTSSSVAVSITNAQPISTMSDLPQSSGQPQMLSTYIPLNDFVGCLEYTGPNGQPLLYGPTASKNTQESCKAFCTSSAGGPYKYFGVENGSECHCGNAFLHPAVNRPGECNTGCSGNATQQCGGALNRMSVWQNSDWPLKGRPIPRPGSGQPEFQPPFDYTPSEAGDGVDDDPSDGAYYPNIPRPLRPPFGISRPPSEAGDGVDGYSFEEGNANDPKYPSKHHTEHPSEHHTKYPSEYPTKQQPKEQKFKSRPAHNQKPTASVSPARSKPVPNSGSYRPYTNLAYPTTPAYPAKPEYPAHLIYPNDLVE